MNFTDKTETVGLFPCKDEKCHLHKKGYLKPCEKFTFISKRKTITWTYERFFDCNSKNLIYLMICTNCKQIYIGETNNLRLRSNNAKKDIRNPNKATVPYAEHIKNCTNLEEPFFHIYPLMYENDTSLRKFKEWRLIKRFNPQLNFKL